MARPRRVCWVITDGRRGIENQALGLAEACARLRLLDIHICQLSAHPVFKTLPPQIQRRFKPKLKQYGLPGKFETGAITVPDMIIGCGRQAIAPLIAANASKQIGKTPFTLYIQHPRCDPDAFDLVVCPNHDQLSGPNVESMIGSPNRITPDRLEAACADFQTELAALPKCTVAVLIGGPSKSHRLSVQNHAVHLEHVKALLTEGMGVMVSTSRRTPDWVVQAYKSLSTDDSHIWHYYEGDPNPYLAFLSAADAILVTQESTNMLTEACTTGKPVFTLPMSMRSSRGKATKFDSLLAELNTRCHVGPFAGDITGQYYTPLNETARIAKQVWTRFDATSG